MTPRLTISLQRTLHRHHSSQPLLTFQPPRRNHLSKRDPVLQTRIPLRPSFEEREQSRRRSVQGVEETLNRGEVGRRERGREDDQGDDEVDCDLTSHGDVEDFP